jgi:small-conductance mechanosensitive channel
LITFESNWKKAKTILQEIVSKHAEHLSDTTGKKIFEARKNYMIYYRNLNPIVYTKVKDSGVQFTMRYLCNPRKRRGSENEIWEEVLTQFVKHNDIELDYRTTRFYKLNEENQIK